MHTSDISNVYAIELHAHKTPWSKEILRDCVLVGYDCRVIEINNVLTGYIISRFADGICHILNICIATSMQSQGWGKQLLHSFIDSLQLNTQVRSVILEVRPSNSAAIHLYMKMGFTQIDLKKDYYKDANSMEDAIVLEKVL